MKLSRIFLFVGLLLPILASAGNESLLREIIQKSAESESDSLVIVQNGAVVYESYGDGKGKERSVQSITKSVVALAIGQLADEGKLSLDDSMSVWFPSWAADARKSKTTLRMVLNHTSGLPDIATVPTFWNNADLVEAAGATDLDAEPGSRFLYSNIGASLLYRVIFQASGKSPSDYVREKLFTPMGISSFRWHKDKSGQDATSGGLYLTTPDLVKIGILLEQGGIYEGKELLRPETFRALVSRSQAFHPYGLLFWLDPKENGDFSARGWGGQYIAVFPGKNLVAVRTKDPKTIDEKYKDRQVFRDFLAMLDRWE